MQFSAQRIYFCNQINAISITSGCHPKWNIRWDNRVNIKL